MKTLVIFACLLLSTSLILAGSEGPVITSARVSPSDVNVTSGSGSVMVSLRIVDDTSGFNFGFLNFYNSSGDFVNVVFINEFDLTDGDPWDGEYTVYFEIPESAAPGLWRIEAQLISADFSIRIYSPTGDSFPVPADMEVTVSNAGTIDYDPPTLAAAVVSPQAVDTSTGSARVTFTFEIRDDISGFDTGIIYPTNPSGLLAADLIFPITDHHWISGDEYSGTYEVEIELPQGLLPGTWTYSVWLRDRVGNSILTDAGAFEVIPYGAGGGANFLAHGLDATHLPFTSGGAGWAITSMNTSDGIDSVMSLPTPNGGIATLGTVVTGPGKLRFWWSVDSEEGDDVLSVVVPSALIAQEISGHVEWEEVELTLPAGQHAIVWAYTKGPSGSSGEDRAWLDQVRFRSSEADSALPVLQSLRIAPGFLNHDDQPESVRISLEISDDFYGLAGGTIDVIDPFGNLAEAIAFDFNDRVSGDENAGLYEVFFDPGASAAHGVWRVAIELREQTSGATLTYGPGGESFPLTNSERFFIGGFDSDDIEAPMLHRLEISHNSVDVGSGPRVLAVTVHVSDLPSGFEGGTITVHNPDGSQTGAYELVDRIGDGFNGIHQAMIVVPEFAEPGTWLLGVQISDTALNPASFLPGALGSIEVINEAEVDWQQPEVTFIEAAPATVHAGESPADVRITVGLADDLSGIESAVVLIYDPSGNIRSEYMTPLDADNRISGDGLNGSHQFTLTLPAGSMVGQWRVHVFVRDKVGRFRIYGRNLDAYPTADDGYFRVTDGASDWFSARMAFYGLTGHDALLSSDPDKDGWSNAEEVLAKTDPTIASARGSFASYERDATHFHLHFTIHPDLTVVAGADHLNVSDGGLAPLRVTGEVQNHLGGAWAEVAPEFVSGSTWRVSLPFTSGRQGFIRLRFDVP